MSWCAEEWGLKIRSMSQKLFVSVVIPTYNRAQQAAAALESVLAQTYSELEVIVVDDGSTDGTPEIIRKLVSRQADDGKSTRYFLQANQGPSVARNKGIEQARGEWIAFLDSDDVWLPEKLESQVQALQQFKGECGGCFTDARLVNDLGMDANSFHSFGIYFDRPVGIASDALLSIAKAFCGFWLSTLIVRTDLARQINGFDPEIKGPEDRDFYFRLALITPLAYVNKPLVRTDRSPSPPGSTNRPWDKWQVRLRSHQLMYEKWLGLGAALPAEVRKTIERDLRSTHSHWANWYLTNEQYNEARLAVSSALHYEFTSTLALKWMLARIAPTVARRLLLKGGEDSAVHSR
jgi:glycosyltransferase involved in cell wall biosynthesis